MNTTPTTLTFAIYPEQLDTVAVEIGPFRLKKLQYTKRQARSVLVSYEMIG